MGMSILPLESNLDN